MDGLTASLRSQEGGGQLLRFLLVGSANTAVAYGAYAFGIAIGLPFQLASLAALAIGVLVSFVTQGRIVFAAQLQGRFLRFVATWAVLYFANIVLIRLFHWSGFDYYLAGLATVLPVTAASFLLQRRLVFADAPMALSDAVLIWLVMLLAVARLDIALRFEANWDEFLNLAMVHSYARGELREVLQTAFVHLFGWLPIVSENELDQVIAGRLLVLAAAAVVSVAIYGTARRFMAFPGAMVSVLAFNGFSFVMRHGGALRTDPLAACAMTVAIWLAFARDFGVRHALALGALMGLAGALTIKAVFYAVIVGVVLLLRIVYDGAPRQRFGLAAAAGLSALASFLLIVGVHSASFPDTASATDFVARTSGATMLSGDFSILLESLGPAVTGNPGFWLLLTAGVAGAAAATAERPCRREGLELLSLGLLLLTPLLYRDVYPYYFAFILAPAAVLAGYGYDRLDRIRSGIYAKLALILIVASASLTYARTVQQDVEGQRTVIAQVHHLFPEPVPYVDHTSMISSFPKQGIFMSRWGMSDYRRQGEPIMGRIIEETAPRFLLVTRDLLDVERLDPALSEAHEFGLLASDVRSLAANYRRYWGPLYLPGFAIAGSVVRPVAIPGSYRVVSQAPVVVDGREVAPGSAITLGKGVHRFEAPSPATLQWHVPPSPTVRPPAQLFRGF